MKEITRVITLQITDVARVGDDFDIEESREWVKENTARVYKEILDVTDAVVIDVQDTIKDIEE